jgi:hypothetical protein
MGQRLSKIERLGLSEVVQDLVVSGITTRAAIAGVLRDQHRAAVSDATVGRYLSRLKAEAGGKAFQIISDHVDRVVPEDLKALEAMEALAYTWAMEASVPQARRIAEAAAQIAEKMEYWRSLLLAEVQNPTDQIKEIISECLSMVQADAREQDQRLRAMRAAVSIIDLKLSKAGLLDDDTKGRIVFLSRTEAGRSDKNDDAPARLRLVHDGGDP